MRVQTKNVMDDVELRNIYCFDSEKHGGIPDLWTPYMRMRRYDAGRIARWSTSRASLGATGCYHRASDCTVLPRRPPWSTNLLEQRKKLTKHNY
jgi:hypothetical protein